MVEFSIIKKEIAFDYSFKPKQLPYHNHQYRQITKLINLFESGKKELNILVYGPPDTEKLSVIRSIFYDYEEKRPEIFAVYVNCRSNNASHKIIPYICSSISSQTRRRIGSSFDNIRKFLLKNTAVFIFDEIEY